MGKYEPREYSAWSHDGGTVLCDKKTGSFLVLRFPEDLDRLKELLNSIEIKCADLSNDGDASRERSFDKMHNEYAEWTKTHKAFECVASSDFSEVWVDAYQAGQMAEREECANVAESTPSALLPSGVFLSERIAANIRKR